MANKVKYIGLSAVFVLIIGFVSACISPHVYRTSFAEDCQSIFVPVMGSENNSLYLDRSGCATRVYALPGARDVTQIENRYTFAYQEFDANGKANAAQEQAIRKLLGGDQPKYVIMFVHGWRHNAAAGDQDIRRFHTLLGYSRSFLNQRRERYQDVDLIGIYVGWYGKTLREPSVPSPNTSAEKSSLPTLDQIVAAPTFPVVKSISDKISKGIYDKLRAFDKIVRRDNSGSSNNRVMVLGHSTGGNILATGIEADAVAAIRNHKPGQIMPSLLGDLTVLINPATEASKLISLEEAMWEKAGAPIDAKNFSGAPLWKTLFGPEQRPIYMSFTATKRWSEYERGDREEKDIQFDSATERWFRLSQSVFGKTRDNLGGTGEARRSRNRFAKNHAVGHVLPTNVPGVNHPLGLFGTTHELTSMFSEQEYPTNFATIANGHTECAKSDGWLYETRRIHYADNKTGEWDSVYNPGGGKLSKQLVVAPSRHGNPKIQVQLRAGISVTYEDRVTNRKRTRPFRPVVPLNAPFWNVRVYDEVIEEHGGYVNHGFFCLLNQLVLDDPTKPGVWLR